MADTKARSLQYEYKAVSKKLFELGGLLLELTTVFIVNCRLLTLCCKQTAP